MKDNLKRCRTCGIRKPIRDFPTPRMRQCTACIRQRNAALDLPVRTILDAAPAALNHLEAQARHRIYQRLRARKLAELKREALTKAGLSPPEPRNPYPWRRCRVCEQELPIRFMANHGRAKICLRCETAQLRSPPEQSLADRDDATITELYREHCRINAIKLVWPTTQEDMVDLFWRARRMLRAGDTHEAIAAWMLTFIQEARAYEQAKARQAAEWLAKKQPE